MNKKVKFGVIAGTAAICTIVVLTIVDGALKVVINEIGNKK